MNELKVLEPTVAYNPDNITYDFTEIDTYISGLEAMFGNYDVSDKKETKELCKELKKVSDGLKNKGIEIEKKATAGIKQFRKDLKERQVRVETIREPIWEQVKPQTKPKAEPKKIGVPVKVIYMFEGDSEYISQMITAAEFNDIKVTEVKL